VEKTGQEMISEEERALREPECEGKGVSLLVKRGLLIEQQETRYLISLTPDGEAIAKRGLISKQR